MHFYTVCVPNSEFPTGNRKRITRVNACESETSATGHFAFSEFANATALPFARRPRASGFTSETPTCLPSYHGMLAITRSPHELQPTHPTPRAARPAGQPLSEPSKRAIDARRAGGTPASATGARHAGISIWGTPSLTGTCHNFTDGEVVTCPC